ncbi:hypothetical protein PIB30_044105 [Stylosanthes scabra]|uniref:Uncharacterized protein n=1 Tax=Stylosanthes scabra TaxID=79078 RepID=A0ABU6ZEH7_9FABA|nr:hypothetical protein [Stylosanthes scabra]
MAQQMRHWMRGVERQLDCEFANHHQRSKSRSRGRYSGRSSPQRQRSQECSRSRSRRNKTPTPPRRRNMTPEFLDDGWEQEIVCQTRFVFHILHVRFPKSFTKPTDMGYDGYMDLED